MTSELGLLVAFFAVVMAVVAAAGYAFVLKPASDAEGRAASPLLSPPAESGSAKGLAAEVLRRVGAAVPAKQVDLSVMRKQLIAAGYRSASTVPLFYGLKCTAGLLMGIVVGWAVVVYRHDLSAMPLPAIAAAGVGYILPSRILHGMGQARRRRISRALPDALDLLVLCVEAGQSLDQALADASGELRRSYPDLGAELALVHLELRAGSSRAAALKNLARRNPDPEMRKLVNVLVQSDRFGTSLGPSLRVHAKYMRIRAKQQAEEAARKISIKLLFPIFFLIFPSLMMVTAGPAIVQIFTQLLPMISGGQ